MDRQVQSELVSVNRCKIDYQCAIKSHSAWKQALIFQSIVQC